VLGGVFIAHTLYQIVLSYGASGLEVRFSYAFMSPDPVSPVSLQAHLATLRHREKLADGTASRAISILRKVKSNALGTMA